MSLATSHSCSQLEDTHFPKFQAHGITSPILCLHPRFQGVTLVRHTGYSAHSSRGATGGEPVICLWPASSSLSLGTMGCPQQTWAERQTSLCCGSPCQGISSLSPEVIKCKIPDLVARWQLHGFLSPGLADWWARQGVVRRTLAVGLSSAGGGGALGQLWGFRSKTVVDSRKEACWR